MTPHTPFRRATVATVATLAVLALLARIDGAAAEPARSRGEPIPLDKLATHAEARSVNHVLGSRLTDPTWSAALVDGDDATLVAERQLGVRYAGAAEFTNEIEVRYRGEGTVTVDLLLPHERWQRGAASADLPAATEWTTIVITVPADRYQGFSLVIEPRAGRGTPEVSELGAFWFEEELTRDPAEVADEWCEDYPGTGNDLTSPNETAQRFASYLDSHGWTWAFDYGNSNVWETDYKRVDLGGDNNSWVDAVDAFLYCGHGSTNVLSLANSSHDDGTVSASDINAAWGNPDMEWSWFHCCLNLSGTNWHSALAGAHTIAGAISVINGSSNWGKTIAKRLIDTGIFDSPETIYQSWWHANDSNQPAGNKFRLLAEDQAHYNEYIWGQGTVQPDSPDATHWTVSHTVSKAAGGLAVFDPAAVRRASEPILWQAPPDLGEPGAPALVVRVHPEVLAKSLPVAAWVHDVLPSNLDDGMTAEMFDRLCGALGLACADAAVGREDEDGYAAAAGLATLSGYVASGGWQFTNQEIQLVPEVPPEIALTPDEAGERALGFLQQLGLVDNTHFLAGVNVYEAAELAEDGTVLQSYPFAYDAVIGHSQGPGGESFPVVGNGGRTHVAVGVDGSIQAFNQVSRRVQARSLVEVISVQAALDQLAAFGYAALQGAPEFPAEEVVVRDANIGYFEQGISDQQTRMGPVYYLDVDLIGADPGREGERLSVPGRLFLASDTLPVHGEILAPGDGDMFAYGDPVSFRSGVVNGTPPYDFAWYSDIHGLLSTDQNFTTDQLLPSFREAGVPGPITIELRVTDANGHSSTDQIAINITGVIGVDDVPAVFELAGNRPNPFNPRTTISFGLPAAGHATLRVMDVRGRLVQTLVDESLPAGRHARIWSGTDDGGRPVASGVYLYRLEFRGEDGSTRTETKRMVLVR
ncbi:MAG TPA: DUF6345 domain-containing protein [Candidatus Krumholzibacteria bacterium]|nr:DUF6345 domain-containing protein [Candidatus Krumholzibacteria bacterium]HPD72648.1 DUF6345 domain-containing protein [Candidatus Krumholzibacteria bacterium]HRY40420.1 DUF6345 domain-containing protein [Candidatus Krumholzibacteria bacterium]